MKTSDLYGCYLELLEGKTPDELAAMYVRIEVLAAQGLFTKGTSLQELRDFQERQAKKLEAAKDRATIECWCGLMCFDLAELGVHLANLVDRRGHGMRPRGGVR